MGAPPDKLGAMIQPATPPLLVFSDLDGTLLDHESYAWAAAMPALSALKALGGGLVLASSKTAVEMHVLRRDIGFPDWPMIVENGAGVVWPDDTARCDDADYRHIRGFLDRRERDFKGFGDMSVAEVVTVTGLPFEAAARAKTRCFSEPGQWLGPQSALPAFLAEVAEAGLSARSGGRFLTLSRGRTKADAMREVVAQLHPKRTLALGDAPNDLEMLLAADRGVVVANPDAPAFGPAAADLERTVARGPAGWNEIVLAEVAKTKEETES